jgi:hypothetical protein
MGGLGYNTKDGKVFLPPDGEMRVVVGFVCFIRLSYEADL